MQQPAPIVGVPVALVETLATTMTKVGVPAVIALLLIFIVHTDLTSIQVTLAANTVQLDRCVAVIGNSVR